MDRFLIPKITRQLPKGYMPMGVLCFLICLLVLPDKAQETHLLKISYDAAGIFWALILSLFLGGHYFWVLYFPGSKAREEISFLSTLPVSRKRIARNDIKIFIYIHSCFISFILIIGLLFFLLGFLTGMQLLFIIVACLWYAICTMFAHLICCAQKNGFIRLIIFLLSYILVFIPPGVFQAKAVNIVTVSLVLFVCSLILMGVSLLIQRYNEKKIMEQDLV